MMTVEMMGFVTMVMHSRGDNVSIDIGKRRSRDIAIASAVHIRDTDDSQSTSFFFW